MSENKKINGKRVSFQLFKDGEEIGGFAYRAKNIEVDNTLCYIFPSNADSFGFETIDGFKRAHGLDLEIGKIEDKIFPAYMETTDFLNAKGEVVGRAASRSVNYPKFFKKLINGDLKDAPPVDTALVQAVKKKDIDQVQYWVELGANIEAKEDYAPTLALALKNRHSDIFKLFWDRGEDVYGQKEMLEMFAPWIDSTIQEIGEEIADITHGYKQMAENVTAADCIIEKMDGFLASDDPKASGGHQPVADKKDKPDGLGGQS